MTPRLRLIVGAAAVALVASASPALAAPADGYVRLAHLSPDTPAVDVYLYSKGKKAPKLVIKHVGYGALSPYQKLGTGSYTVAMRPADATAGSKPLLSTDVTVKAGDAYTVAGMGPFKGIKLQVLKDSSTLTAGNAGIRVLAASLKSQKINVKARGLTIKGLDFANISDYQQAKAGPSTVKVTGAAGSGTSAKLDLAAGSLYTVVVLDGETGLRLLPVRDTASGKVVPNGAIDTGLGGLAHRGGGVDGTLPVFAAVFLLGGFFIVRRIAR
jgi:hypothetical protein